MKKKILILSIFAASILSINLQSCKKTEQQSTENGGTPTHDNLPGVTEEVSQYVLLGSGWSNTALTFSYINRTNDLTLAEQKRAIRDAFDAWSQVSSLRFTEIATGGDIQISFETYNHGDGENFDGPSSTINSPNILAHAFPPTDGRCHFDDSEIWTIDSRSTIAQPIDLVTTATHEIGHLLGIGHSAENSAVMFAAYGGSRRQLTQDDIDAIQALYPPQTMPHRQISYSGTSPWQDANTSGYSIEKMLFGDMDGDGKTDVFVSSGGRWMYSKMATSSWQQIASSSVQLKNLALGDFNGDGKTDVFSATANGWRYSSGGTSNWISLAPSTVSIENLRFGDFNGDGKTDVFSTTASGWRYSSGGTSNWIDLAPSSVPIENLRFGDFNGDGKTDVFTTTASGWRYSSGGTSNWIDLAPSTLPIENLRFGDFNGDGKTDVFSTTASGWRYSSGGTSNWIDLAPSTVPIENLRFGDFNGDGKTDVLRIGF